MQALSRYEHEDLVTDTESTGGKDTCHATRKRVATAPRESCDNTDWNLLAALRILRGGLVRKVGACGDDRRDAG